MKTAEIIKASRERANMTQEDLAEKLDVSRQAVSKWEMGLSVPDAEHLRALSELFHVEFPAEGEGPALPARKNRWKTAALILAVLLALSVLPRTLLLHQMKTADAEAAITCVSFYDEAGTPFDPNDGANWYLFDPGSRVWMAVSFEDGTEDAVHAVSLFLTPTGTETFDQRQQLAVQSRIEQKFALFVLDIPEYLMGHLEIRLECSGGKTVTEELNVGTNLL